MIKVIHRYIDPHTWHLITRAKDQHAKSSANTQKLLAHIREFKAQKNMKEK